MNPLDYFAFSQSSLQDYVDCHRRFQLRYLERVAWPAVQAEPVRENERHIQRGERFHRLAQQCLIGIPKERLAKMAAADEDDNLQRWWENFTTLPDQLSGNKHVEITLSGSLGPFRLNAKYDLVLIQPDGKAVIYDWKTSTHRPKRDWLRSRLQTRVYPYLLVNAGAALNQQSPIPAESIEMVYWFTEPDHAPERFTYSPEQYEADHKYLLSLASEIQSHPPGRFDLTTSLATCRFCVYRSLCDRGARAGGLDDGEDEPDYEPGSPDPLDFDLEQIGEISF